MVATGRSRPRVSIGLPVYNGENYVASALDSIVAQTFDDFEVIISDNASSDRTEEICRDYAAGDRRLHYTRNSRNLGAGPNWNRAFQLSSGEYFKWAAHDDLLHEDYLAKMVAALDAAPDAVLGQSLIEFIDSSGSNLGLYDSRLTGAEAPRPSARFAALVLRSHTCTELYGLIRRTALLPTQLHRNYHGGDRALLAELALRGPFLQVREPLLRVRDHPARYTRSVARPRERLAWHDSGRAGQMSFPTLRLYAEYMTMVSAGVPDRAERVRCYGHLLRWWLQNWNWARTSVDLLAVLGPDIPRAAEWLKRQLFGAAPGHFLPGRRHPASDGSGVLGASSTHDGGHGPFEDSAAETVAKHR